MTSSPVLAADHCGGAVEQWAERLTRSVAAPDAVAACARAARCLPVDDDDAAAAGLHLT